MHLPTSLLLASLLGGTSLAGCMTPMAKDSQAPMMHGRHSEMDMAKMCDDHRQMMATRTPDEQQKMMETHVQSMHGAADPKMVMMHQQMMDKRCAQTAPAK